MNICLIGDPHFANRKMFAGAVVDGVNARLRAVSRTLKYIGDELPADLKEIVIMGDITHDHGLLTPPVQHEILKTLDHLTYPDRHVYLITGNHDMDTNGLSILKGFERSPQVHIITHAQTAFARMGFMFRFIPYGPHEETIAELADIEKYDSGEKVILLMHHHFDGAQIGGEGYTPSGGLSPKHIPKNVEMVFTGHYHRCHTVNAQIFYVGAPLQHDFGETTYEPCYHILEPDKPGAIKIVTYPVPSSIASRFHIIPHNLDPDYLGEIGADYDYYRIDWPMDEPPDKAKELAKLLSNVIINPVPVIPKVRSRVEEYLKLKEGERVQLPEVIDAYAALHARGERYEEMLELGLDIARSVIDEKD